MIDILALMKDTDDLQFGSGVSEEEDVRRNCMASESFSNLVSQPTDLDGTFGQKLTGQANSVDHLPGDRRARCVPNVVGNLAEIRRAAG